MKLQLERYQHNPFISPNPDNFWEAVATFNGCIIKNDGTYHLLYRALSKDQDYQGKHLQLSTIGYTTSKDGVGFTNRKQFIAPEQDWEKYGCEDPRVTKIDDEYFIFYTALSEFPPTPPGIRVALAITKDFQTITEKHLITPFNAKAMALFPKKINGKYVAILTANTDIPPAKIAIATFDTKEQMWSSDYWRNWYQTLSDHTVPLQRMNSDQIEVGAPPIETEYGWLFIYAYIKNYYIESHRSFRVEAVLLDKENPQKVIARVHESVIEPEAPYEKDGMISNIVFPSGALIEDNMFHLYYGATDSTCCRASCTTKYLFSKMQTNDVVPPKLIKHKDNPIMLPKPEHNWEAQAVFNPAAIYEQGKIHIIYRAMSHDNTSTMGYAISSDGLHIDERLIEPVYLPRVDFEDKRGKIDGNSGCEDGRITRIGDMLYMTYTAYNGVNVPRVAMSFIKVDDFVNRRWVWSQPVLISPPGVDDKDCCIFPEKINGKYVIFHRIDNDIVIDYVDDLNFDGKSKWLRTLSYIPLRQEFWDEEKVGIAAPPIKTDKGWFILYHGISKYDRYYRVGAMLLDLNDPSKIISRLHYPILEPETRFEKEGIVNNVVFPCGTVVINDILYVYYGGADRVVCVATINFPAVVAYLDNTREKKYLI